VCVFVWVEEKIHKRKDHEIGSVCVCVSVCAECVCDALSFSSKLKIYQLYVCVCVCVVYLHREEEIISSIFLFLQFSKHHTCLLLQDDRKSLFGFGYHYEGREKAYRKQQRSLEELLQLLSGKPNGPRLYSDDDEEEEIS